MRSRSQCTLASLLVDLWVGALGTYLGCSAHVSCFASCLGTSCSRWRCLSIIITLVAIYQQAQGKQLVVYLLFLVWAADTGAYLAGKRWGRHKLIPAVSPGKTIEGTLGGMLLALLVAYLGTYYFNPHSAVIWYAIAGGIALISIVGDLFISMLKRRSKLKDTGSIFPGHGGVLDRIDSLIAAMPLFYYCGLFYL